MLFVHAERNGTKVNLQVRNVPELYDPEICAKHGTQPKTVRESAEAIVKNLQGFGWYDVKILSIGDAD